MVNHRAPIARPRRAVPTLHTLGRRGGFTLPELVLVVVIAGILTALALPRLNLGHYRADASAQALRSILQQAQRASLQRQYDIYVLFDTASSEITVAEDINNDGIIQSTEHIRRQALVEGAKFLVPPTGTDSAVGAPIVGRLKTINSMPAIVFHRDGAASTDLEIYIATPAHPKREYRAIKLARATGRTDWYRLNTDANKWIRGGQ